MWLLLVVLTIFGMSLRLTQAPARTLLMDWSSDGQWIVTVDLTQQVLIWDASTGLLENSFQLRPPDNATDSEYFVSNVIWRPNADELAILLRGRDSSLIFNLAADTFETSHQFLSNSSQLERVLDIVWSPDGEFLAAVDVHGTGSGSPYNVFVWNATTGELAYQLNRHGSEYDELEWNPDTSFRQLAMFAGDAAQIWDIEEKVVYPLQGHTEAITSMSWNSNGTQLATIDIFKLYFWSPLGEALGHVELDSPGIYDLFWVPNENYFVVSGTDDTMMIMTVDGTLELSRLELDLAKASFRLNKAGTALAVSRDSSGIQIYDLNGSPVPFCLDTCDP